MRAPFQLKPAWSPDSRRSTRAQSPCDRRRRRATSTSSARPSTRGGRRADERPGQPPRSTSTSPRSRPTGRKICYTRADDRERLQAPPDIFISGPAHRRQRRQHLRQRRAARRHQLHASRPTARRSPSARAIFSGGEADDGVTQRQRRHPPAAFPLSDDTGRATTSTATPTGARRLARLPGQHGHHAPEHGDHAEARVHRHRPGLRAHRSERLRRPTTAAPRTGRPATTCPWPTRRRSSTPRTRTSPARTRSRSPSFDAFGFGTDTGHDHDQRAGARPPVAAVVVAAAADADLRRSRSAGARRQRSWAPRGGIAPRHAAGRCDRGPGRQRRHRRGPREGQRSAEEAGRDRLGGGASEDRIAGGSGQRPDRRRFGQRQPEGRLGQRPAGRWPRQRHARRRHGQGSAPGRLGQGPHARQRGPRPLRGRPRSRSRLALRAARTPSADPRPDVHRGCFGRARAGDRRSACTDAATR